WVCLTTCGVDVKAAALKLMFLSGEVSKREKFLWRYLLDLDTDFAAGKIDFLKAICYNIAVDNPCRKGKIFCGLSVVWPKKDG
ncbi:hypothetical protein, partial [Desulfofundulus thermobenzoicus]|uniref:hypothetical protein n=1 Tax=Desulfofundulus thermobenzoicus TaxID=29376 RepID=UPI001A9ACD28